MTQLRRMPSTDGAAEVATNINSLVQRVAGASLREMQNVIWELESLRDFLQSEGERVQREISSYAQLTQAAMKLNPQRRRQHGAVEGSRREQTRRLNRISQLPQRAG